MKVKRKNKASILPWGNNHCYHFGFSPFKSFSYVYSLKIIFNKIAFYFLYKILPLALSYIV